MSAGRSPRDVLLSVRDVSKTFAGARVLQDVSLDVRSGEVVAVVGHNGSGKSTLVKILAGVHQADAGGEIEVRDATGAMRSGSALREVMHFIHQDLGLIDVLSTVENLSLGRNGGARDFGPARGGAERRHAEQLTGRFGVRFDTNVPVATLSPAEKAIVAIARALDGWTRPDNVLILDEPTVAFHESEVETLFRAVRRVAADGAGVVFISHRLDEVLGIADRVVVLRDGCVVADRPTDELDHDEIVKLIVGRSVDAAAHHGGAASGDAVLRVEGVSGDGVDDMTFSVHQGEIVGVSGLLGSGREHLCELLFGARRRDSGLIEVAGSAIPANDVSAAIDAGLALLPADRRGRGAVMDMTVRENLTLPQMRPLVGWLGWLRLRAEVSETHSWIARVGLRPPNPEMPLRLLSGGNQQKVVLAKWLRRKPRVLLLDEPTQGVDVGAKAALYDLIAGAVRDGAGVVLCSSDIKELVALSDRVLSLRDGRIVSEISRDALSEERLAREELRTSTTGRSDARWRIHA